MASPHVTARGGNDTISQPTHTGDNVMLSFTLPTGHDGVELHATLEPARHGGYHATWLLFDDDANIISESPSLPKWYMDYCPNEIAQLVTIEALHAIGRTADDEELTNTFPCTCDHDE